MQNITKKYQAENKNTEQRVLLYLLLLDGRTDSKTKN